MSNLRDFSEASERLVVALENQPIIDGVVKYECSGGDAVGVSLYNTPEMAVQVCHVPNGTKFVNHIHPMREYVIVYHGSAAVDVDGKERVVLKVGDYLVVEPNTRHNFEALEDCWVLGVTIPASRKYPA